MVPKLMLETPAFSRNDRRVIESIRFFPLVALSAGHYLAGKLRVSSNQNFRRKATAYDYEPLLFGGFLIPLATPPLPRGVNVPMCSQVFPKSGMRVQVTPALIR